MRDELSVFIGLYGRLIHLNCGFTILAFISLTMIYHVMSCQFLPDFDLSRGALATSCGHVETVKKIDYFLKLFYSHLCV